MTYYEFEDVQTEEIELVDFPMADVPRIGDVIERDGRRLRRIISSGHVHGHVYEYEHVSNQLARGHPDAPHYVDARPDRPGKPAFKSKRERDEFKAKHPQYGWD